MSFIDDFIYKVKTGRLFAGSPKAEDSDSAVMEELNRKLVELETRLEATESVVKHPVEPEAEVMEQISRQFMVFETRLEAMEETGKQSIEEENPPETTDEADQQAAIRENQSAADEVQPVKPKEETIVTPQPVKRQIGPDVIIQFVFMGKTYIVENFNLNFRQDVDSFRNRPDSFTYGGTMQITISGFFDSTLNEWIGQTYLKREGEIHFFPNMPKITDSALLTIFFSDACCVACKKEMNTETSGVMTRLTISPRTVKIGNEELNNKWKKEEPLPFTIHSV